MACCQTACCGCFCSLTKAALIWYTIFSQFLLFIVIASLDNTIFETGSSEGTILGTSYDFVIYFMCLLGQSLFWYTFTCRKHLIALPMYATFFFVSLIIICAREIRMILLENGGLGIIVSRDIVSIVVVAFYFFLAGLNFCFIPKEYSDMRHDIRFSLFNDLHYWIVYRYYYASKGLLILNLYLSLIFYASSFFWYDRARFVIYLFVLDCVFLVFTIGFYFVAYRQVQQGNKKAYCLIFVGLSICTIYQIFKAIAILMKVDQKLDNDPDYLPFYYKYISFCLVFITVVSFVISGILIFILDKTFKLFERSEFALVKRKMMAKHLHFQINQESFSHRVSVDTL